MEKPKLLNSNKIGPISRKEKVANKIASLWDENSRPNKSLNTENKKLVIKLDTSGEERRKMVIKLESTSSKTHNNSYYLISELLKEFFNGKSNFE